MWLIVSYLLGSIPSALWVGRVFYQKDIRQHGSGNLGATNTFRVLGKKAGMAVLLLDVSKGSLSVALAYWFSSSLPLLLIGLGAILGHSYPLFASFRGGKSVATTAGVLLVLAPQLCGIGVGTFLLTLLAFRYVSLASIMGACAAFFASVFLSEGTLIFFIGGIVCFILFKHRKNIARIQKKEEPKLTFKKKTKQVS